MKEAIWSLLLIVVLSSLVMAGSEINTNFIIGEKEVVIENYIPNGSFWNNYSNYIIAVLVIFVIGYFVLKIKDKKLHKSKKISKKQIKKKSNLKCL